MATVNKQKITKISVPKKQTTKQSTTVVKKAPEEKVKITSDKNEEVNTSKLSKKMTPESLEQLFIDLDSYIETEIKNHKKNKEVVKTLRTIRKDVKNIGKSSVKMVKVKPKVVRKMNPNAGFYKPVLVSKDLAKFAGWDPKEMKTRVDATRYLCQYIKDNNLQNPSNRREIVPDKSLSQFLKFDKSKNEPLTYSKLQTYMKPHFIKT